MLDLEDHAMPVWQEQTRATTVVQIDFETLCVISLRSDAAGQEQFVLKMKVALWCCASSGV
jgi:hypothetical protein